MSLYNGAHAAVFMLKPAGAIQEVKDNQPSSPSQKPPKSQQDALLDQWLLVFTEPASEDLWNLSLRRCVWIHCFYQHTAAKHAFVFAAHNFCCSDCLVVAKSGAWSSGQKRLKTYQSVQRVP